MLRKLLTAASAAAVAIGSPTSVDLEGAASQVVFDVAGTSPLVVNKNFFDSLSTDAERDAAIAAFEGTKVIHGHTTKLAPLGPCADGDNQCAYGDSTWERLFQINHRTPVEVTINTQGGWFGPTSLRFEMMVDYSGNLHVKHISSLAGTYVSAIRVTTDNLGQGPSMVEVLMVHRYGQQHPVTISSTSHDLSTAVAFVNAGENLPALQVNGADFYSPNANGYAFDDLDDVSKTISDTRLADLIDTRVKAILTSSSGVKIGHEGRSHLNWARVAGSSGVARSNGERYHHIKTNLWGGGGKTDPFGIHSGEDMYIMGYFKYHGYRYAVPGVGETHQGFHNWAQNFHNLNTVHETSWQVGQTPYMSTEGYVVIVVDCGSGYSGQYCGVTIDLHQTFPYPYRTIEIVDRVWSSNANGVF